MPTIDERIVEMQFDNKDFEKNVGQSIKTLDTLKKSLNLKDSNDGLEKFAKSFNKVDLSGIKNSIDDIGKHFTVVGRFIDRHIDGIIRSVEGKLTGILKSISIDQIATGMSKYETQTKAVQTITNATGKSVEEVEQVLGKLMKYTDETSYDFVTMAESIGKFTSVGVELATAEKAMEGIANEAAISGAGKAEANRAMYNFAQALSAGKVQLIDWKSIENANMATKEFKEELIKTAIEIGTVKKTGEAAGKTVKGTAVDFKSFNQTLSEGWLTSDVLIKTLEKYSDKDGPIGSLGRRAYEAAQKALTFTDAMDAIKDAVSSQWMTSFKYMFGDLNESMDLWTDFCNAVIEVTGAIGDYRNELLQGWHQLGGYNAMIQTASNIWGTFVGVLNLVRDAFAKVFPPITVDNLISATEYIEKVTASWKEMFGYIGEQDVEEEIEVIKNAAEDLADSIDKGVNGDKVKALQQQLIKAGYKLDKYGADGVYGPETQAAIKQLQADLGIEQTGMWDETTKAAAVASKKFEEISSYTETVTKNFGDTTIVEKTWRRTTDYAKQLTNTLKEGSKGRQVKTLQDQLVRLGYLDEAQADAIYGEKTEEAVKKLQEELGVEVTGVWDEATKAAVEANKKFVVNEKGIINVAKKIGITNKAMERLQKISTGGAAAIDLLSRFVGLCGKVFGHFISLFQPIGDGFLTIISVISDCIVSYRDYLVESGKFEEWFEKAKKWLEPFGNLLKRIGNSINNFFARHPDIKTFTQLWDAIVSEFKQIPIIKKIWDKVQPVAKKIKDFFDLIKASFKDFFSPKEGEEGNNLFERLKEKFSSFESIKTWLGEKFTNPFSDKNSGILGLLNWFVTGIKNIIGFVSKLDTGRLITFVVGILGLLKIIRGVKKLLAPIEFLKSITESISSIGDYFSAKAKTNKFSAIGSVVLKFSVAIALLAGSITLLASLDQKKAWSAVGVVAALSAIIVAFSVAANKFAKQGMAKSVKGIIKLSAGLLILSVAISILAKLSGDQIVKGLGAITYLLIAIGTFSALMKKNRGVKGILSISAAIMILALAMKAIGGMDVKSIAKSLTAIGVLLIELGAFMTIVNGKKFKSGPLALVSLGVCIKLLASSLQKLAKLSWGELLKGLAGIGALLLELVIFTKLIGGKGAKGLFGLIGVGVAVNLIARSFSSLAKLSWEEMKRGAIGLGLVFIEIAGFLRIAASKKPGKLLLTAISMIAIGGALLLFTKSINTLAKIKVKSLIKAIVALGVIFLEILTFMKLMGSKRSLSKIAGAISLIGIAAAINLFVLAIKQLGSMKTDELVRGIAGLGVVLLEIANFMRLAGKMRSGFSAIPMLIIMATSLLAFGIAIKQVADIPWYVIIAFGVSFGIAMKTLSSAMFTLSLIPISGAIAAIANLDIFIANTVAVLGALGGLQKLTEGGLGDWLASGGQALGQAIGGFIAGITDPFKTEGDSGAKETKSFTEYLNGIITDLDGVMETLKPFLDKVGTITEEKAKGVANLVGIMAMMSGEEILDSISGFVSGSESGSGFIAFAEDLVAVVPLLAQFSEDAAGVNEGNVKMAEKAMGAFTGVARAVLPLSGGEVVDAIASFISGNAANGKSAFVAFSEKLVDFIPNVVTFSEAASGVSTGNIDTAASAITSFVGVAMSVIPLCGTEIVDAIASFISGDAAEGKSSFVTFAEKLAEFIPKVVAFSDTASGLNTSGIDTAAAAMTSFVAVGTAVIPLCATEVVDAIAAFISGDGGGSSFLTFADKLVALMPKIAAFSILANLINQEGVQKAATAMEAFGTVCNAALGVSWTGFLENIVDFINGDNDILSFTDKMIALAPKLKSFGDQASSVDATAIQNSASALEALANAAEKIPGANGLIQKVFGEHDIADFGGKLEKLGEGLNNFYSSTKDIPSDYNATGYIKALAGLTSIAEKVPKAGGWVQEIVGEQSLDTFGSSLETLGTGLSTFVSVTEKIPADYNTTGPLSVLTALSELESGLEAHEGLKQWIIGDKSLKEFGEGIRQVGIDLFSFNLSTVLVNTAKLNEIATTLSNLAAAVYQGGNGAFVAESVSSFQTMFYRLAELDYSPLIEVGTQITTNVVSGLDQADPSLPTALQTMMETASTDVSNTSSVFQEAVGTILTAMSNKIKNNTSISTAFGSMMAAAVRGVTEKRNLFVAAGIFITLGLAKGIGDSGAVAKVKEAARQAVMEAKDAAEQASEQNSPSKVFAKIGQYMTLGMAVGMEKYASTVKSAAVTSVEDSVAGAKEAMKSFSSLILEDIDDTPVIRPVLDLSNVTAGASSLGGMFGTQTVGLRSTIMANKIADARVVSDTIRIEQGEKSSINSSIDALNSRIDQLGYAISNMKVVTETGAIIGAIAPGMDRALGKRASRADRGG